METLGLAVLALIILGFGLISGRIRTTVLTPPMIFVALGFAVSQHGLGILEIDLDGALIHTLAELTLILVLFTDASRIDLKCLRREHDLPVRLLVLGMPLTLVAGTLAAFGLLPHLGLWEAVVLAAILAPTDAALGQAVVSNELVPVRVRQALNVESGLNDGIALPLVLILISCGEAAGGGEATDAGYWLRFTALQVTLGPVVGALVGYFGGRLVHWGQTSRWMSQSFQDLAALGLSLLAFAGAEVVGGNGFIAAFVAGLVLGNTARHVCACLYEFAEAEGQLLTLLVFLVFGAVLLPGAWEHLGWRGVVYGVLSLTLVRMAPVALALLGKGLRRVTVVFLGWFGPRGLASILFALLVVDTSTLPHREEILTVVMTAVTLSIVAHGVTAWPGATAYARRMAELDAESTHEHMAVTEMPVRLRHD